MCFSPEASFGAAAIISTAGVISIRKAETSAQKMFALIPLFFAFQQFIEGILWLVIPNPELSEWKPILHYSFLVVAWIIWPVFIPLSTRMLETNNTRKKLLTVNLVIGIVIALLLLFGMVFYPIDSSINDFHIDYTISIHRNVPLLLSIGYVIPTVISHFISSVRYIWLLGLTNLSSYAFTKMYFTEQVISVWCFFGAISSILILWIVYQLTTENKTH